MAMAPARFVSYGNAFAGGTAGVTPSEESIFTFIAMTLGQIDLRGLFDPDIYINTAACAYNDTFGTVLDLADAVGQANLECGLCRGDLSNEETLWLFPAGPRGPELRHTQCGFDVSALVDYINALLMRVVADRVSTRYPGMGPPALVPTVFRKFGEMITTYYRNVRDANPACAFWDLRQPWNAMVDDDDSEEGGDKSIQPSN